MKKEAAPLSHDLNARNDPKILILRSVYGLEGYGRYWVLIEMMREQKDCKIMLNAYIWNALALQLQCSAQEAREFVEFSIKEACLFESDKEAFWSPSLLRRAYATDDAKDVYRERAKKAAAARWNKALKAAEEDAKNAKGDAKEMLKECISNANASEKHPPSNAIALDKHEPSNATGMHEQCKRKEKEAKRKEIYINTTTTSSTLAGREKIPDELTEAINCFSSNIHPVSGEIELNRLEDAVRHYGSGWVIKAIERAVIRPNGKSLGYVLGILQKWENNGFDTEEEKQSGKNSNSAGNVHRQRKKNTAARKETDWESEPDGLPPI